MSIAWVNNRWLKRPEREAEIHRLRTLRDAIYDEEAGTFKIDITLLPPDDLRIIDEQMSELERLERINNAENDLLYFCYEYFGDYYNADNDGNWIPIEIEHAPQFHREICEIMNGVTNDKVAVAAPRSHAKSSFLSKGNPLHEIVYRRRKYVIIISETPTVATGNLDWLALQLKSNAKLRADFGPLLSVKQQENPKDNSSEFIAWEPREGGGQRLLARVEAASTGQALRGRNWNGVRPDLIICDDLEGKKNTNTDLLRQEMRDWFTQVVVPLGDPAGKKTALIYMGTMVHHDSLLRYVMESRSDFKTRLFRAVIQWPARMDLWEECRQVYTDRDNPDRAEAAEEFYHANKAEMDGGSIVLWPEVQPLWTLMTWKWNNGSKAFNTEYMNNPVDEENMIFNPANFTYWDDKVREIINEYPRRNHDEYEISLGVDFALGKTRGDYSAITVAAKHRKTGTIYVIDSYGERIHPDKFIAVITEKVLRWQPDIIAAEAQAAQEFFVDTLAKELARVGYPAHSRLKKVHQRSRKEMRIEMLLPLIESKELQFSRKHALLLEQFELYGTGTHDDLPDSCEMAVSALKQMTVTVRNTRKRTR
ncbi:phage terminase large subunit [Paenibacillus dakarensis]|uniref:phage terminase large subunit n=1 Tax=Paenibacillus dakarensis TaxID=1527293 RepID=UPI000ADC0C9E|nr:phage terminase large subunit [Paenibacillus dakarensis]